jgi:hypothetical protein
MFGFLSLTREIFPQKISQRVKFTLVLRAGNRFVGKTTPAERRKLETLLLTGTRPAALDKIFTNRAPPMQAAMRFSEMFFSFHLLSHRNFRVASATTAHSTHKM